MSSVRRLVSAVTADDLLGLDIRIIDVPSVVNLWASTVTVTDTLGMSLGKVELLPQSTGNVRAAAVGLVLTSDDQLVFNLLVGPDVGDLKIAVNTLTTSLIYVLSVEPFIA